MMTKSESVSDLNVPSSDLGVHNAVPHWVCIPRPIRLDLQDPSSGLLDAPASHKHEFVKVADSHPIVILNAQPCQNPKQAEINESKMKNESMDHECFREV